MVLEIRRSGKALRVKGAITLERAAKFKTELLKWMRSAGPLVFDFEAVTEVDLSCLQILCSTCITADGLGKQFTLNGTCSDALKQTVRNAGYSCLKLQDENKMSRGIKEATDNPMADLETALLASEYAPDNPSQI